MSLLTDVEETRTEQKTNVKRNVGRRKRNREESSGVFSGRGENLTAMASVCHYFARWSVLIHPFLRVPSRIV